MVADLVFPLIDSTDHHEPSSSALFLLDHFGGVQLAECLPDYLSSLPGKIGSVLDGQRFRPRSVDEDLVASVQLLVLNHIVNNTAELTVLQAVFFL